MKAIALWLVPAAGWPLYSDDSSANLPQLALNYLPGRSAALARTANVRVSSYGREKARFGAYLLRLLL